MEPMDLLADTRRYLASAIKQLEAINAGAPIAEPVTREQAINIVTEQIAHRAGSFAPALDDLAAPVGRRRRPGDDQDAILIVTRHPLG